MALLQYRSQVLGKGEWGFSTFEKEPVAVIFALKTFMHHFLSGPFIVYSNHKALRGESKKYYSNGGLPGS